MSLSKSFSNWWNRAEIQAAARAKELSDAIEAINTAREELRLAAEEKAELEKNLAEANALADQLEAARVEQAKKDDHQNSTEPWVDIKSDRIDPIKGLVIELDWNEAFIQYLKENGITGRDPETAVQKWVAMLYQNLMIDLEDVTIEKNDQNRPAEYE